MTTLTSLRLIFKAAANLSTQLSIVPSTYQTEGEKVHQIVRDVFKSPKGAIAVVEVEKSNT